VQKKRERRKRKMKKKLPEFENVKTSLRAT
jgi:hypothetical protein